MTTLHRVPDYRWKPLLEQDHHAWRQQTLAEARRPAGLFAGMVDALSMAAARLHHGADLDTCRPWLQDAAWLAHAGFMLSEGYVGEALDARFDDPIACGDRATMENWLLAWCVAGILGDGAMQARLIDRPVSRFSPLGPPWLPPLHDYLWSVTAGDSATPPQTEPELTGMFERFARWPDVFAQLTEGPDPAAVADSLMRHAHFAAGRNTRPDLMHTVAWIEAGVQAQLTDREPLQHGYVPAALLA